MIHFHIHKIIFAQNQLKSCSLTQIFKNLKTAPKTGKRMKNLP